MTVNVDWLLSTDYADWPGFLAITGILFAAIFLRYLLLAFLYQKFLYGMLGQALPARRLHQKVSGQQIKKEILYSLAGSFIFALSGTIMLILWQRGYTLIYLDAGWKDIIWIPASLVIALLIHETYYYWLHRWMHRPQVLGIFHKTHHDSKFTDAFTSFSFHPYEAFLQAVFMPLLVLILPIHVYVLVALLIIMSISAVINHAAIEIFPASFLNGKTGKWLIGATHHDMHHLYYNYNFGLYFTFWDVWMKTEHQDYARRFSDHTK